MRLLVSVRNAGEARNALSGGAEIIDAKEPEQGALGPVSHEVLREIRSVVPAALPCSAALGDVSSVAEVHRALAQIGVPLAFVKFGFRNCSEAQIAELLGAAVAAARGSIGSPQVVAVAYADHRQMKSPEPVAFPPLIRTAGAAGLLVDSGIKDGQDLFDLQSSAVLARLAEELRRTGAFLALGGNLDIHRFGLARATGAAIIGVRGAACVGGRNGMIDAGRVERLRVALESDGSSPISPASPERQMAEPRL